MIFDEQIGEPLDHGDEEERERFQSEAKYLKARGLRGQRLLYLDIAKSDSEAPRNAMIENDPQAG
jgi:hypothetical protein